MQNIKNNNLCYGITHCDGKLYYCHEKEGIQRFYFKTKFSSLLVPTKDVGRFSSDGNKLFYTSNTETVTCCDMNGKQIWKFHDTSLLRLIFYLKLRICNNSQDSDLHIFVQDL
jgi:hypothetical protein